MFLRYSKKRMLQLLFCSIVMQNIQIFYGGPVMFIVAISLVQSDFRNFLPEHCNAIIKQQLFGEELPSLLPFLKLRFFKRSRVYCSNSTYAYQTSQKKLSSGLLIQIIPPKVLQECTAILQMKVYIVYMVRKLVDDPHQEEFPINLGFLTSVRKCQCFFHYLQKQHAQSDNKKWVSFISTMS